MPGLRILFLHDQKFDRSAGVARPMARVKAKEVASPNAFTLSGAGGSGMSHAAPGSAGSVECFFALWIDIADWGEHDLEILTTVCNSRERSLGSISTNCGNISH